VRKEEKEKLQQPYPEAIPIPERFADALGVVLPAVRELQREVFADFDDTANGVGWWAPHPGASRRILISDHLLTCIVGIKTNLVEARLHLMELRDFDEQVDGIIAHAVKHDREGRPSVRMPPRAKAADDLPDHMAALHIAGFFRAVGSALDCLGAAIIGVLALPTPLLKADIDKAIGALDKVKISINSGDQVQVAFRTDLAKLIGAAGPPGWLPWATDYRNMLVHRGRRLQLLQLEPRGAALYAADGTPVMLARAVRQLAQDPGLSDVEALLSTTTNAPVLTEDARTTLDGLMASALSLSEVVSTSLVDVWRKRRAMPSLLKQPNEQWRDGRSSATRGFAGYKPGSVPFRVDALVSDETFARRLQSAAINDVARKKWDKFD
jgi:hypothetical protein